LIRNEAIKRVGENSIKWLGNTKIQGLSIRSIHKLLLIVKAIHVYKFYVGLIKLKNNLGPMFKLSF
jgi:hypothetical protein